MKRQIRKQIRKRCMAGLLALSMMVPMFMNLNVQAEDKVVDTFYVLDEKGNPVLIEITQSDLDSFTEEDRTYHANVLKSYDGTETVDETEADNDESDDPAEEPEDIIGIVRFNRDVSTFKYKDSDTGRSCYMSPMSTGDAAYIGTNENGVVCFVSGTKIIVAPDDVAEIVSYKDQSISTYYTANGYLVHRYSYFDGGEKPKLSTTYVGVAPSYLEDGVHYYSYDGHYFYETFETMIEDYRNDVRTHSVNPEKPHYNYYQYLSLHTTAVYTGAEYDAHVIEKKGKDSDSVMLKTGSEMVNTQNTYTINSLMMFGIAINESGWGMSSLAKNKNNLFGLNAVDSNPYEEGNSFSSTKACIEDFAYGWMHTGYMDGTDSRYRGPHLGDKHSGVNVMYASDPYWGEKAASRPYYFDTTNKDYGRFTLGIANKGEINLYKEPDTGSKVIYTSEAGAGGDLYDYPVTILDTVTGSNGETFYKVISDMALKNDRSARDVEDQFKPSRDYVYAKEGDIQIVLKGNGKNTTIPDPEELSDHIIKRHTYKTVFTWSEDYKTCKITFSCSECNTSVTKDCKITSVEGTDTIEYTAVCEYEGKTYTDKKVKEVLPFKDVKTTDWFYKYVEWAYKENVTVGYLESDGSRTFKPNNSCSRAENVTFLYNLLDGTKPAEGTKNPFTDVKSGEWYYDFVIWASQNGITNGYKEADGTYTFRPLNNCTRAEIITFIYNVKEGTPIKNADNPFTDVKSGEWYYDFVLWGYKNGVISGYEEADGTFTFRPDNVCSRAEVARMLYGAFAE